MKKVIKENPKEEMIIQRIPLICELVSFIKIKIKKYKKFLSP